MAGINALIARIQRLGADEVRSRIMVKVASAAHAECIRGFNEQRDPYGVPWAPRKTPGSWRLLDKSGDMINSLTSRPAGERVLMRIKSPAIFHQRGTIRMVARKIFPEPSRGLGTWADPIRNAAKLAIVEAMRSG